MAHVIPQRGGSLLYKAARSAQITIHQLSRPILAMKWPSSIRRSGYSSRQSGTISISPLRLGRLRRVIFEATCPALHSRHATSPRCFDFSFGLRDCNTIELLDGWLEIRTRSIPASRWQRVFIWQLNEELIGISSSASAWSSWLF